MPGSWTRGVSWGSRQRAACAPPRSAGSVGSGTTAHPFVRTRDGPMATLLDAPPAPSRAPEAPPSRASLLLGRIVTALLVIGPVVALAIAVPLLWGQALHPRDVVIAAVFYLVSGFGVTVGYHRLFTHRSFRPARWLKITLASAGSLAVEGSLVGWVANHRRHHVFSDKPGDPHSPHLHGTGVRAQLRGFFHAHVGWLFKGDVTSAIALRPRSARRRRCADHQPALSCVRGLLVGGAVLPRLDALGRDRRSASPRSSGPGWPAWCCCTT